MNYATLQTNIAAWMHRNDLTSQIPTFIEMAEARFNRDVRVFEMEESATGTATTSFALPADFLAVRTLTGAGKPMTYIPPQEFDRYVDLSYAPNPRVFTIRDGYVEFLPATEIAYAMHYYAKIPALSNSNTTNWLLDANPDVYIHGALVQAKLYVQDPQGAALSEANALAAIESLRKQSARKTAPAGMSIRVVV